MIEKKKRRGVSKVIVVTLLLMGGSCGGGLIWLASRAGVPTGSILELQIDGTLPEGPSEDVLAQLMGEHSLSLFAVRRALRAAATDDAIAGVLVEVEAPQMGMASLEELASEFERFGKSGKPLHVLVQTDMIGEAQAYLAAAATKAWATPAAFWMLDGYQANVTFWRGTLDKLHIEPDFIMFKEYKSAGEPFSRSEMSEYFREAILDVVGDLQDLWYAKVAERRGIDRGALEALVAKGMSTAKEAKALGLVDAFGYVDEVHEALREVAGTDEYQAISAGKYLERVGDAPSGKHIAVVFGEGQIVASRGNRSPFGGGMLHGPQVAKAIHDAAEEEDVVAIVFRVNSPGGSAVGSDLVWREIERAKAMGKPVVVSMSDVAGSGGYWVSMGADAIVAQPATITGSIGVVFGKFNLRGFYKWIGANVESISFAENSDIMSAFSTMSEAQRAYTVSVMNSLYIAFETKVATGRGLTLEQVETVARGRIWSGRDAIDKGLVDELGGLEVALALAAKKAGLDVNDADDVGEIPVRAYPEAKGLWQMLQDGDLQAAVKTSSQPLPDMEAAKAMLTRLEQPRALALMPGIEVR